jgi:hypothetical protein
MPPHTTTPPAVTTTPAPTEPPVPSDVTCWSVKDTSRQTDQCKVLPPPELSSHEAGPNCTGAHTTANRVDTCSWSNCYMWTGGLLTNDDGVPVTDTVNAPKRVYCDQVGIDECFCTEGTCKSKWGYNLCLDNTATVKYGIARDTLEWQCPFYYCQVWDHTNNEWRPSLNHQACSKICIPELYKGYDTLPADVSTEQQISLLKSYRQPNPPSTG